MTKITDAALKKLGFSLQISESDGGCVRFELWQNAEGYEVRWTGYSYSLNGDAVDDVEDLKKRMRVKSCD